MRSNCILRFVTILLMSVALTAWVGCEDDHKVVPPYYEPVPGPEDTPEEEPGENPGENPGEEPGENPGENPGEEPGENPGEEPGENPGEEPVAETPKFEEFSLVKAHNSSFLSETIVCNISEDGLITYDEVIKTLNPVYTGVKLKPAFKVKEGIKVYVGDEEQVSNVTKQDFTKDVTYRVVNTAGDEVEYTVSLDFAFTGLPIVVVSTENGAAINYNTGKVKPFCNHKFWAAFILLDAI